MSSVRVLILRTAGTNCDRETAFAFELQGGEVSLVHLNRLRREPRLLAEHQILVLPGGFTYGDDISAGKVLAVELLEELADPLREFLVAGKLVLGICNGFQTLVKARLLPGPFDPRSDQMVSLTDNDSGRFEDRWVHVRAQSARCAFVEAGCVLELPVAHAEGKFVVRDRGVLETLRQRDQIVFRYVGRHGADAVYPENPNGSVEDIAGICDATGRILGLMPHPERHVLGIQGPRWSREGVEGDGDGSVLFRNAIRFAKHHL